MINSKARWLSQVLVLDAVTCAAMGIGLAAGAAPLATRLGLPDDLLVALGLGLLMFASLLGWTARQQPVPATAVRGIVAANLLWVVASIGLVLSGAFALTSLGTLVVLVQAAAVLVIAEFEIAGLRRHTAAA